MSSRRAARDHDERPSGPSAGGRRDPVGPPARGGAVAPHPRPVPAVPPDRPAEAPEPEAAVEVEPTTGAPVDALPRRAPLRQPRRLRRGRSTDAGTPADADDAPWAPIEQVHWDGTPVREEPAGERWVTRVLRWRPTRAARPAHPPDPLPGLAALVALSLAAAFFAWVSAAPFWLAVGHATPGRVVVDDCTGGGLGQRCRGTFVAERERFFAHGVAVSGVPRERATPGATMPARMTGPDAATAYADTGARGHLRWLLGLVTVLGCAVGIVRWTGAARLADPRARRWAVGAGLAGPLLITVGFLVAAW
ncbi:hypothetical protein ACTMSW_00640 [Micromonospora sp. BQ11]|uniref:hypothetical protein n=1 Tax=Micromonospora sp. BQ11 TaxID=3452212 RepID=UPI003F8B1592